MATIINATIELLAARPMAFSTQDIADYTSLEGLEDTITAALRVQCVNQTILRLDDPQKVAPYRCRYLGMRVAEKWWVDRMVKWATAGVDCITPAQLAGAMSLAFDNCLWNALPPDLLAVGRRWAMVAEGYVPGTFVFPWASVLRSNPQFMKPFCSLFSSRFSELSLETVVDQALNSLSERDTTLIRGRFGLDTGYPATLEQLGRLYNMTRERVRQIIDGTLRSAEYQETLWLLGFVTNFMQSGGSLLIQESMPHHKLCAKVWELNTVHIKELNIRIITTAEDIADYHRTLSRDDAYQDARNKQRHAATVRALQFLSHTDGIYLQAAEEKYRAKRMTHPRMLYQALRSLGRAAHYTEIAEECNRLFPENQNSVRNWHAALSQPTSEGLGIVWIGQKGMYGLKEHGYSRPDTDLFNATAEIVEAIFAKTQRPVAVRVVMTELSKRRRELNYNSVKMALSFNDRLEPIGSERFIPKIYTPSKLNDALHTYDIDAAFQAFSANEEDN